MNSKSLKHFIHLNTKSGLDPHKTGIIKKFKKRQVKTERRRSS